MRGKLVSTAIVLAALAAGTGLAAPQGDALKRTALSVRQPERTVLQAAAQAGSRVVAVGERGVIVISDDGGDTWRQAPCPVSVTLTAIGFADARNGVAVGHGGVVLTTADAGASWALKLDGLRLAKLALDAARTSGDARRLKEAERLVAEGADKPFLDVAVLGASRYLAVGAYGIAFATDDAGRTWTPWMARFENPKSQHLYVVRVQGDSILLAGEQGLVALSADRGATFRTLVSPYKGSWFAGELGADNEIVLAGMRGNVWRSADGGANWIKAANPVPASITASAKSGGGLLLASQAGLILKLHGDALVPLNTASLPAVNGLLMTADKLLALGVAGVAPVPLRAN
jgi:photosystem II stability/assembly factor-like uncharacterized protein